MPRLKFNLVVDNGDSQITVYHDGETHIANNTHPAWEKIVKGVLADDETIIDLFNIPESLSRLRVSDRVSIANSKVYFDNDEVHDTLTEQIVRIYGEDGNPLPWVRFLENLAANPNPHSREHLYRHLKTGDYTITDDGLFVGYKYVKEQDGGYVSDHAGYAVVNGEVHEAGRVPNDIGNVIEMPRSRVTFDPNNGCSFGLHVGNWGYVSNQPHIIEVHVNPRDVVSVPVDSSDAKVRVCRYRVVRRVTKPYTVPVVRWSQVGGAQPNGQLTVSQSSDKIEKTAVKLKTKETAVDTASRVRYPRPADWNTIVDRAKTRKQNLIKYVQKMTDWKLLDGREGRDRKDWAV